MKYFIITTLIFLFGCHSGENETLAFLNEGIERCNEYLDNSTIEYYSKFEAAMLENPSATKPHKQKVDSLREITYNLFQVIDSLKQTIIENNDTVGDISYLYDSPNVQITQLKKVIESYNKFTIQLNNTDSIITKSGLNIKLPLRSTNDEFSFLSLHRLVNRVHSINYQLTTNYYKKSSEKKFSFREFTPVVIPKRRFMQTGEIFKAKVFLAIIDTTAELKMRTQTDLLLSKNGRIHFEKFTTKPGSYKTDAILELQQPKTKTNLLFPFEIKYEVMNSNRRNSKK